MLTPTKRTVRVTLDIECYDDLDLETYDWNEVLGLEGDENPFMLAWKKSNCGDMMCQFVICPPPPGGGFFMITGRQERWRCIFVYSGTPRLV